MLSLYTNVAVLVTGGAGFIGSHVVEQLVYQGAQVRVLDNLSTGKRENLARVAQDIEFIEGDITDYQVCMQATHNIKIIFHLAAQTSVPGSVENPMHCFKTNVTGTLNLLEAARTNQVQRIVFSSSSAVYGCQDGVFIEDKTATKPESPYGLSKLLGEMLCKQYYDIYGVETVSMRYFNVYGERQDPSAPYAAVVPKFLECMQHNKPLVIYGDGHQTRDFISVVEVAKANLILGSAPAQKVCGAIFNVASGKSMNLFQLAEMLKHDYPSFNAGFEFRPSRPGDVKHTCADCSKYNHIINDVVHGDHAHVR